MINDDKTFYHKALIWSAFFVLGDKTICYCLSSLRNISSPYFTLNRNFGAASLNKHNRRNSDCSFNKNKGRPFRTILFGKSTVQTFVTLDTSTRYTN